MTRTQALATHLLQGKPVSIKTAYKDFGISNISREVARLIERPFGLYLTRTKIEGKTKYGTYCLWFEYRLMHTKFNATGIKKLKKYLQESVKKEKV